MTDDPAATLEEAKRIADALQFACRIPDRKPDFFACGGPAAEAYWDYFTPARVVSLVAALEAILKLGDRSGEARDPHLPGHVDVHMIRDAITRALNGDTDA